MYQIKIEPVFKADYKRVTAKYPQIKGELKAAIAELVASGVVPEEYRPHELLNAGGNYNGHIDFHLSDGKADVLVLYMPHKTIQIIRLVRMGSHEEFFSGPVL